MHDDSRTATFSSSQAFRLMKKTKASSTYIQQVRYEIKLGRAIKNEFEAKQTSWGTFLEGRVFRRLLDSSYQDVTKQGRLYHPAINHYSGVPDFLKDFDTVADCKCPFNLEKFCAKMEALEDYEKFKDEFPEDFWQLISNTVLLRENGINIKFIESINYVPYLSELPDIRMSADGDRSMKFLDYTTDNGLPWLPDGGNYKNINIRRFEVMERDVDEWTECIKIAVDTLTGVAVPSPSKGARMPTVTKPGDDPGPKRVSNIASVLGNLK